MEEKCTNPSLLKYKIVNDDKQKNSGVNLGLSCYVMESSKAFWGLQVTSLKTGRVPYLGLVLYGN
jgi:hypothetical protein